MGLRNWITRPIKGHHIGIEDLTAGGSGIPVGYSCSHAMSSLLVGVLLILVTGDKASAMDARNNRFSTLPGLGSGSRWHRLPNRCVRTLRLECRYSYVRLRLLA
jgi:hypothetical protein